MTSQTEVTNAADHDRSDRSAPGRRRGRGDARWGHRVNGLVLLALCAGLLVRFVPYGMSVLARETLYLNDAEAEQVLASDNDLARSQNVSAGVPLVVPANADLILQGYDFSLENWSDGRVMRQKAVLDLRLARYYLAINDAEMRKKGMAHLGAAQMGLLTSTKVEPLNQFAWANLAYLFTWTPGPSYGAALALERSWRSGATDKLLWPLRIELGWRNYRYLSDDGRARLAREVNAVWDLFVGDKFAYTRRREKLIAIAEQYGDLRQMREMIGVTAQDRAMFNAIVVRRAQKRKRGELP